MVQRKRVRTPEPQPGVLEIKWGRPEPRQDPDLLFIHGGDGALQTHSRTLMEMFENRDVQTGEIRYGSPRNSLRAYLEREGYDITTLKFSIKLKETPDAED